MQNFYFNLKLDRSIFKFIVWTKNISILNFTFEFLETLFYYEIWIQNFKNKAITIEIVWKLISGKIANNYVQ